MTDEFTPAPAEQSPIPDGPEVDSGGEQAHAESAEAPSRSDAIERAFEAVGAMEDEAGRLRNPDGKFASRSVVEDTPEGEAPAEDPENPAPEVDPEAGEARPISEAPSRFSADAKAAWADAPEAVRGEITRAIGELESGLAQKDEQLAPLKPYFEMAEQHGVTVDGALGNYINMENQLRADLPRGMQALAQNLGMTVEDMFAKAQNRESASTDKDRTIVMLQSQLGDLTNKINGLEQGFQTTRQDAQIRQVEEFAAANPRFSELEGEILQMIETGYAKDLAEAYQKADRLNPAPQPAPEAPPAPAQTRPARSVTGAPTSGSTPAKASPSKNRTEAVDRALRAAGF